MTQSTLPASRVCVVHLLICFVVRFITSVVKVFEENKIKEVAHLANLDASDIVYPSGTLGGLKGVVKGAIKKHAKLTNEAERLEEEAARVAAKARAGADGADLGTSGTVFPAPPASMANFHLCEAWTPGSRARSSACWASQRKWCTLTLQRV